MVKDVTVYYKVRNSTGGKTIAMPKDSGIYYSRLEYENGSIMFKPRSEQKSRQEAV